MCIICTIEGSVRDKKLEGNYNPPSAIGNYKIYKVIFDSENNVVC